MADRLAHAAHLTVAPLSDRQLQHLSSASRRRVTRTTVAGCVRWPSSGTPLRRRSSASRVGVPAHAPRRSAPPVARVCQPRGEVAVVGQQQQALAVVVETTHRVDILAHAGEQIDDRAGDAADRTGSSRSPWACSAGCSDAVPRPDAAAIHADVIGAVGLDAHLWIVWPFTVTRPSAISFFSRAARGHTRLGLELYRAAPAGLDGQCPTVAACVPLVHTAPRTR